MLFETFRHSSPRGGPSLALACVALVTLSAGCSDSGVGRGGIAVDPKTLVEDVAPPVAVGCDTPRPGAAPLRRLTNFEFENTVTDLLGDAALAHRVAATFPEEPTSLGFRNNANALQLTPLLTGIYLDAAVELAASIIEMGGVVPCAIDDGDEECAAGFITEFGPRAYRRPLTADERERYLSLFRRVSAERDFAGSVESIAAAMLSSSHFLFRVELDQVAGESYGPAQYELASRLSYLLWQSMPDEDLFEAAKNGELSSEAEIEQQVLRMLADEKSERLFEFFRQWLDLDELEGLERNPDTYGNTPADLPDLLQQETRVFVLNLLQNGGTFQDLVSAPYTYVNANLAQHYGMGSNTSGDEFVRVEAADRAGVLTQGAMLVHDRPTRTSIVRRGLKIRTDILCQNVPAPPANVQTTLGPISVAQSQRERLEQHRSIPTCTGCHALMDPLGVLFEGYGATGQRRTQDESGALVNPSSDVIATTDLDGSYADAVEFAQALGASDQARRCFAQQAFRFFYGRGVSTEDGCTQAQLMSRFEQDDYQLLDLVIGLTKTDQFLYREHSAIDDTSTEETP